jgi:hypothetical protein
MCVDTDFDIAPLAGWRAGEDGSLWPVLAADAYSGAAMFRESTLANDGLWCVVTTRREALLGIRALLRNGALDSIDSSDSWHDNPSLAPMTAELRDYLTWNLEKS